MVEKGDLSLLCQTSRIKVGMQLWPRENKTMLAMTTPEHTRAGSSCRGLMTVLTDLDLF